MEIGISDCAMFVLTKQEGRLTEKEIQSKRKNSTREKEGRGGREGVQTCKYTLRFQDELGTMEKCVRPPPRLHPTLKFQHKQFWEGGMRPALGTLAGLSAE